MNSTSDDTGGGRPQKTASKDHKKVKYMNYEVNYSFIYWEMCLYHSFSYKLFILFLSGWARNIRPKKQFKIFENTRP